MNHIPTTPELHTNPDHETTTPHTYESATDELLTMSRVHVESRRGGLQALLGEIPLEGLEGVFVHERYVAIQDTLDLVRAIAPDIAPLLWLALRDVAARDLAIVEAHLEA